MIPWVREKFAERRAKWVAARKRTKENVSSSTETAAGSSPATSTSDNTTTERAALTAARRQQDQQQHFNGGTISTTATVLKIDDSSTILPKLKSSRKSASIISSHNESSSSSIDNHAAKPEEKIKIRVISPSGRLLIIQADVCTRLVDLKQEILSELSDDCTSLPYYAADVRQLSPRYRLLKSVSVGLELNESHTLAQHHITENDTLVLVARRTFINPTRNLQNIQAPTITEIEQATQDVRHRLNETQVVDINEIFQQSNLQFDVRKVLISLAQASATVIGSGPYASRLIAMLKQKLINKRNHENDTLQCLVEMGFAKEKASHALKLHNGVYSTSLEWLIKHQSDELLTENKTAAAMSKSQSVISTASILTPHNILENTEALLEIVRIYSHRDIPPNTETVSSLVDMGFAEQDVLNALKKTCNNKAAACEWLCGNRSDSLIELREGLSQHSPILTSILELPQVQMSLSNPKILLAFLSILENENTIRVWGGDSDTTSVITHILQKYHEEKHVLGINQFYDSR